jgi:hypothetical protein
MRRRNSTRQGHQPITARWIVEYGGLTVECRDETDAKSLAARLHKRACASAPGRIPVLYLKGRYQLVRKHWLANRTTPPRSSKAVAPPSD